MAVPRCVLSCSLRGGIARTAGWSDGFRQVASFSSSAVISNGLQPSLEGLGPTSELVDGRVQTWTRHGSDQDSASEHMQDVHRNVCETIGHVQPTRMGDRFWQVSPRGIQVVGRGHRLLLLGVRQYAVVLSLRLSFCPGFLLGRAELSGLRFRHFYVFRGPGAGALGHTGSLPGCPERGVLCPG